MGIDAFATINAAVPNTGVGGTIHVGPGTYSEQLFLNQNVNIVGYGQDSTTIQNPGSLTPDSATGQTSIIDVGNAANVSISGLTVSGPGLGFADLRYGIYAGGNSNLDVSDVTISHIRDASLSGVQSGVGIRVGANFAGQIATAAIRNVTINDYQKGGVVIDGAVHGIGSYASIIDSIINGAGLTSLIAQNGIQVSRGGSSTITGDTITGNAYSGPDTGTGILFYNSDPSDSVISGNSFSGNQHDFIDSVTQTTLVSSLNPAPINNSVTFTATVSQRTPSSPTSTPLPGTVQFYVDGVAVGSPQSLNGSNQASITLSNLSGGNHTVTAVYSGSDLLEAEPSSASITQTITVPKVQGTCPTCPCPICDVVSAVQNIVSSMSPALVNYFSGATQFAANLLSSGSWGLSSIWTNAVGEDPPGNGSGVVSPETPALLQMDGTNTLGIVLKALDLEVFDLVGGTYRARYFDQSTLVHDNTNHQYVLTDELGNRVRFGDFSADTPAGQQGQFVSYTDAGGNTTSVTSRTASGQPAVMQSVSTFNGVTTTDFWTYSYISGGINDGLLQSVGLTRQVGSGTPIFVREAVYTYYDGTNPYGNAGDLMTACTEDGSSNIIDTNYFRYYTQADITNGQPGYVHGLKFAFSSDSYARLVAAVGNPTTATDSQVAPFADDYYQYDAQQRVTQATVQSLGCSSCSAGLGTFTYSYTASTNPLGFNSWAVKTVEITPDGNQNIVYTNSYGEIMLNVHVDTTTGQQWDTFYEYDDQGRCILQANPSAVTGFNDAYADLLNKGGSGYQYLSNNSGLITLYDYYTGTTATDSTPGGVIGYEQDYKIEHGQAGTPILQEAWQYYHVTATNGTVNPVATDTVFRNTDGTGAETTTYSYAFYSGTTQIYSQTATAPTISASQNGPGTPDVTTSVFDTYGRTIWTRDGDGFINYTAYDQGTGAVVESIVDVNTANTSDFVNLPSGWATPTGGGLNLVTSYVVDNFGRATTTTSPNGNVTYLVYDDLNQEVRVYQGWNSDTGTPTGPTQVFINHRALGYTESFTMAAVPHLTGGVPDGTESISDLQTLERYYLNSAGQVTAADQYFNLAGLTYTTAVMGALNVNFYQTQYGYDHMGRQDKVVTPTGTITRIVYDSLSRLVSTWIGTNDTPSSGFWSPSNPAGMTEVSANVYDNGGVGDSDLTQTTQFPGLGQPARVTQYFYDWRDRLVAMKSGVQATEDNVTFRPITFITLDNLGEATLVQRFDGDGVNISTINGEPQAPSASPLWAQTAYAYDDQGRVYRQQVFDVTPGTGAVSISGLTTNYYFGHRGDRIAVSAPSGLWTKDVFDGADRLVTEYTTDGGSGTTWADASTVANDIVLEQTQNVWDGDSNDIETITSQRFDDAGGATGPLGTPTSGVPARLYYSASYFDAADRDIADVNVGTNGGTPWTRLSTVPARSDTALVTTYEYDAAGWLHDTIDPRGIDTRTINDALDRTTESIQNYTGNPETATSDVATLYTYDGDNHTLTITAEQPLGTPSQTTAYVYGVTTAGGSGINSSDLLATTQYPDPTTGLPSTNLSQQETYSYDALGETVTRTDRNGSTHQYSYDVLGRLTTDAVTTLGAGVDGSVRRLQYAYDEQGNQYLATSYDASTGGNLVNQVLQKYNGLGQLIAEYQATSGAVDTGTTPEVQYAYTEMSGGQNNSRLISMTYPSGYVVNYNYGSIGGLNDRISRLDSISDPNGTLESYKYLGLSTVVERDHPQTNLNLTYISQTNSTGDAGDKYTGLDRFGRVVEQNWYDTSTAQSVEDLTYSYDRDSNVLARNNALNSDFSETYSYDSLSQLASFARANGQNQVWTTDALGNATTVTTDGVATDNTFNTQNQQLTNGTAALTFDQNGNMTTDETGRQFFYDAWNRLVGVKDSGGATLAAYGYDALGRRVTENQSGSVVTLYYSSQWQVLEERVNGTTAFRYVWSPVFVDAMVLRDQLASDGSLDQRLYPVQDSNWNVAALVDTSGAAVERFAYSPYGVFTVYDGSWNQQTGSRFAWVYLFQGGRYESVSGLYDFRNRSYSPALGKFVQTDPIQADNNSYRFVGNDPVNELDPSGLAPSKLTPPSAPAFIFRSMFPSQFNPSIQNWDDQVAAVLSLAYWQYQSARNLISIDRKRSTEQQLRDIAALDKEWQKTFDDFAGKVAKQRLALLKSAGCDMTNETELSNRPIIKIIAPDEMQGQGQLQLGPRVQPGAVGGATDVPSTNPLQLGVYNGRNIRITPLMVTPKEGGVDIKYGNVVIFIKGNPVEIQTKLSGTGDILKQWENHQGNIPEYLKKLGFGIEVKVGAGAGGSGSKRPCP
jgi:RHS repeat-associated protein